MRKIEDSTVNERGDVISNVSVTVYLTGTATLATLYSDDGVTTTTNPVTSDSNGKFSFYVEDGRYDLTFTKTGITTRTITDMEVIDWKSNPYCLASMYQAGTATAPSTLPTVASESASGGSIDTATYYYVITYFNKNGETTKSPVRSFACSAGSTNKVKIRPADFLWRSGCYGFRVYVGQSSSGPFYLHTPAANSVATTGHYIWGDIILTSLTFSGTEPPATNTAAIDAIQVALNATSDFANNTVSGVMVPSASATTLTTPLMLTNQQKIMGLAAFRHEQSVNSITTSWVADAEVAAVIVMGTANAGSVQGIQIRTSGHGILFVGQAAEWYFRDMSIRCTGSGGTYAAIRIRTEAEIHNLIFEEVYLRGDRAAVWVSNSYGGNNVFRNSRWDLGGANGYLSTGGVADLDRAANPAGIVALTGFAYEHIFTEAGTGIIWDFLNTDGKLYDCSNADPTPASSTTAVVRYAVDADGNGGLIFPFIFNCVFNSSANYGAAVAITSNTGNTLTLLSIQNSQLVGFTNAIDGNNVLNGSQIKLFGCSGPDSSTGASAGKIINLLQNGAGLVSVGCVRGGSLNETKIGPSLRIHEQTPNNANSKIIDISSNTLRVLAADGSTVLLTLSNAGALGATTTVTGTQLVSSVATGTAPLTVSSTTNVANLNASSLSGATFAAPGAIGGTTPAAGTFTTLATTATTGTALTSTSRFKHTNFITFADADTTPTVANGNLFKASNTGATSITAFDDGVNGQVIRIIFTNGNTTIVAGANMKLAAGLNLVGTADDTLSLVFDGTSWFELSRSVNA